MVSDQQVQRRLVVGLALYEGLVIFAVAAAGVDIATHDGSPLIAATPVVVVAASEALRVPLSAWATRLTFCNQILAFFVLACLAVASAEGLALSFDNLIAARTQSVRLAEKKVDVARAELMRAEAERAPAAAALTAAERELDALDARQRTLIETPPQVPGFSGTVCRSHKGNTYVCPADSVAQRTYAASRADYARQISALEEQRTRARREINALRAQMSMIDTAGPTAAAHMAQREYADSLDASAMHRIAASWFGARAAELTEQQFSTFRKYTVSGLSVALASMSALVAWLAFQTPRSEKSSKLSRALRGYLARRRKAVVRKVKVPSGVKIINRYIPVSGDAKSFDPHARSGATGVARIYPELFNAD